MIACQTMFSLGIMSRLTLSYMYIQKFTDSLTVFILVVACKWPFINRKVNHKLKSLDSTTCHINDQHALTLPSTKTFKNNIARVEKMIRQILWNHQNL